MTDLRTLKLHVVARSCVLPDAAALSPIEAFQPLIVGDGDDRLLCGACEATLAEAVAREQLEGLRLICPRCRCTNEVV